MSPSSSKIASSPSLGVLIVEGLALLNLGLALTTEHWLSNTGSPPQSAIMGALFLFFAICMGVVAAVMLFVNVFRKRIDAGTIIAVLPFLGFSIWGIWYSSVDVAWKSNLLIYWSLLAIVGIFLIYVVAKYFSLNRR